MPKEWAKVYRNAPLSEHLAELFDRNPAALAMFWPLKALADDFGRYTANPRKFAHNVGGLCGVSTEAAAQMITDMAAAGVVELYEIDGDPYLQIAAYHNHEEPKWYYVGKAEWPTPPGWEPPESLVAFLRENKAERNVTLTRYGVTPGTSGACDDLIAELEPPLNEIPTPVEPEPNHSSTTVEPQFKEAPTVPCQPDVDSDVDSDVDVDTNKVKGNVNDSLSDVPSAAPDAPPQLPLDETEPEEPEEPDKPEPPKKPKPDRATQQQMLDALREPLADEDVALIDAFLEVCAAENKSGEIQLGRRITETRDLITLRDGDGQTVGIGAGPWQYGMNAAIRKPAGNIGYVKAAAKSWHPQSTGGSRGGWQPSSKGVQPVSDHSKVVPRPDGSVEF